MSTQFATSLELRPEITEISFARQMHTAFMLNLMNATKEDKQLIVMLYMYFRNILNNTSNTLNYLLGSESCQSTRQTFCLLKLS